MRSCMDVLCSPLRRKQARAATRICSRRAVRWSSDTRGTPHILKRTLVLDTVRWRRARCERKRTSIRFGGNMQRKALALGVLIAVIVVAVQALLVPLFAAPAANIAPRDLPIAVAGPPALAAQLEAEHPGAFEVHPVADAAAADAAIKDREVYGAILVSPTGPEVHIASAASPTVATLLTQAAAELGPQVAVRDIVPLDPDDAR